MITTNLGDEKFRRLVSDMIRLAQFAEEDSDYENFVGAASSDEELFARYGFTAAMKNFVEQKYR